MKLFTIGESVAQGFMSAAAARTDLCFSTLIARALSLSPNHDYQIPFWPEGGHPVNLEMVLRRLNRIYGNDIFGPIVWPLAANTIADLLDRIEDYYERGPGAEDMPYPTGVPFFHNVSVRGFDVADAWKVTPQLCRDMIRLANEESGGDNWFQTPNGSFYRTALEVLSPTRQDNRSALDWLEHHAKEDDGVENLILWLGSNNALGTVVDLDIVPSRVIDGVHPIDMTQPQRAHFNLWLPEHFEAEYDELFKRVHDIMTQNENDDWRVFIGNVPAVTVAPLAKGVGEVTEMDDPFDVFQTFGKKARYYKYYIYFLFEEKFAQGTAKRLTRDEAYYIDSTIAQYNKTIKQTIKEYNEKLGGDDRYFLVDVNQYLLKLAYKRNNGNPPYWGENPDLAEIFSQYSFKPNTKYYHADRGGNRVQGGLASLDGVHPTAIGQGILAYEFMKVMHAEGIDIDPMSLNWDAIISSDRLWSRPLSIMQELYEHETLAKTIVRFID